MKDIDLRKNILAELEYDPSVEAAGIAVAVNDGTVTLSGHVRSYTAKRAAENVVKRVKGVRAISQQIEVRPRGSHVTADDEIAKRAAETLRWSDAVPRDAVQVKVANGWLILMGKVRAYHQKAGAERAVHNLMGVKGVNNQIVIEPEIRVSDVKERIESALRREAELEARRIVVSVTDRKVTLRGDVRNWAERQAAERAAWAAPGVTDVVDHISIVG